MAVQTKTLRLEYKVDSGLVFNCDEFLAEYLVDLPIRGLGGGKMTRDAIEEKIKKHTAQLEHLLDIKIPKQAIREQHDYNADEFACWGFVKCNYLINSINDLKGKFNSNEQVTFPDEWISIKNTQDSAARNLHIVPYASGTMTYSGNSALFFYFKNSDYIPNYWHICYITGFDRVPKDLMEMVGKLASISVCTVLSDVAFGAGIASMSVSLDGLSQSIGTSQSAQYSLYGSRIFQLANEMKREDIPRAKARYKGMNFGFV